MNQEKLQAIIPYPEQLTLTAGVFKLTPDTPILVDKTIEGISGITSYLAEKVESMTGFLLHEKDLLLQKVKAGIFFNLIKGQEKKDIASYEIIIEKNTITISASTKKGLFYGAVTLFQIICFEFFKTNAQEDKHLKLPCLKITDRPRLQWRGLLLDCSRHFMSKEFVKMTIDILALYKMNKLHWHLTDDQGWRIEIKKYPLLTSIGGWRGKQESRYGGFYSQDDIREIVRYAESRFVEIIPEIEMPGHAVAALAAYPEYSCTRQKLEVETRWGIFDDVFCAGNEKTYEFLHSILDEVCTLFPSNYIHLGGDEVPVTRWSACPLCENLMDEKNMKNPSELESHLLKEIISYLKVKGKKAICWDEVTENVQIRDVTVQYWRSFVNEEILTRAAQEGYDIIFSPTSHCYLDYPMWQIDVKKIHSIDPFRNLQTEGEKSHILGIECNMWTEHAPEESVLRKILPRMIGLAEAGWTGPGKEDFLGLENRLLTHRKLLTGMGITMGEILAPDFEKPVKLKRPAAFSTTMGIHEKFTPERAFSKDPNRGFYWTGRPVKKDESFTLTFKNPQALTSVKVNTRCTDVIDNPVVKGLLEISIDSKEFVKLAEFKDGVAEASFEEKKIKAIRVRVTEDHASWVVISDIIVE